VKHAASLTNKLKFAFVYFSFRYIYYLGKE